MRMNGPKFSYDAFGSLQGDAAFSAPVNDDDDLTCKPNASSISSASERISGAKKNKETGRKIVCKRERREWDSKWDKNEKKRRTRIFEHYHLILGDKQNQRSIETDLYVEREYEDPSREGQAGVLTSFRSIEIPRGAIAQKGGTYKSVLNLQKKKIAFGMSLRAVEHARFAQEVIDRHHNIFNPRNPALAYRFHVFDKVKVDNRDNNKFMTTKSNGPYCIAYAHRVPGADFLKWGALNEGQRFFDDMVLKRMMLKSMQEVVNQVVIMHQKRIVHKDIKPENLMFNLVVKDSFREEKCIRTRDKLTPYCTMDGKTFNIDRFADRIALLEHAKQTGKSIHDIFDVSQQVAKLIDWDFVADEKCDKHIRMIAGTPAFMHADVVKALYQTKEHLRTVEPNGGNPELVRALSAEMLDLTTLLDNIALMMMHLQLTVQKSTYAEMHSSEEIGKNRFAKPKDAYKSVVKKEFELFIKPEELDNALLMYFRPMEFRKIHPHRSFAQMRKSNTDIPDLDYARSEQKENAENALPMPSGSDAMASPQRFSHSPSTEMKKQAREIPETGGPMRQKEERRAVEKRITGAPALRRTCCCRVQ